MSLCQHSKSNTNSLCSRKVSQKAGHNCQFCWQHQQIGGQKTGDKSLINLLDEIKEEFHNLADELNAEKKILQTLPKDSMRRQVHAQHVSALNHLMNLYKKIYRKSNSEKPNKASYSSDVRSPTSTEVRSPTSTSTEVRSPTSTSTEVRSPTSTSTEVRSPTSTSTDAYTQGNVTVTGGAGAGATFVYIGVPPISQPVRSDAETDKIRSVGSAYRMTKMIKATGAPRVKAVNPALMYATGQPRVPGTMPPMIEATGAPRPLNPIPSMMKAVNNKPSTKKKGLHKTHKTHKAHKTPKPIHIDVKTHKNP